MDMSASVSQETRWEIRT